MFKYLTFIAISNMIKKNKSSIIIILQFALIAALASMLLYLYISQKKTENNAPQSLLSPKICSKIDEPKSFTIFDYSPLQEDISSYIGKKGINASIYIKNLRNGATIGINAGEGYFPASLNKLPVAIMIMERIENGELSFETMINITDEDRRNTSGDLYKIKEKQLPLRLVLEKMLKDSDNTAFYALLNYIDTDNLKIIMDYFGADIYANYHTKTLSLPNNKKFLSPRLMSNIFSSLYFSTVLEPQDSQYILSLMTETAFDIKKEANLPDKVIVSQKFGQYYLDDNKYFHSCGIMYIDKSRIFYCIMTKDLPLDDAKHAVGFIVHDTYQYVVDTRTKLDKYKVYVENS